MGNRIRELRKERKLTMKQLGDALGLAESTISQYENEKRSPDVKTWAKMSEFFHVSTDYLLGYVSDPFFYLDNERILREINDRGDGSENDDIKYRLFSTFEQLNEVGQQKAIERLEELLEVAKYRK